MIRHDLRLLTALGALALLGCPGDDAASPGDGDDTETSTTAGVVTITPMTGGASTGEDLTSTGPDTTADTTDGETDTSDTTDTGGTADTGSESSTSAESGSSSGSGSISDGPMCDVDQTLCDDACVDPMTDSDYCGATGDCLADNAGVVCEDDQSCVGGACQCDAIGEIACDGACIDPMTNPDYCGAINDCSGMDAGEVCSPSATCTGGGCMDTCDNCSFETGDLTGWDASDLDSPFFPLQVGGAGVSMNVGVWTSFASAPTEGSFACLSGFDGDGATGSTNAISIGQDIALAADPPAELEFDYRAAWDLANFGAPMFDRTLEVHIEPAGGGAPMQMDTILTAEAGTVTEDDGDMTGVVDLSAFAGSTVYVRFVQTVPEDFAGPGFMQIDNVRVVAQ